MRIDIGLRADEMRFGKSTSDADRLEASEYPGITVCEAVTSAVATLVE